MQIQDEKVTITTQDLIYAQVKDLSNRMERLEKRMDRLEEKIEKQDEKFERLADKIDALRRDLSTGTNHNQVMTGSIVAIALSALYFVATH